MLARKDVAGTWIPQIPHTFPCSNHIEYSVPLFSLPSRAGLAPRAMKSGSVRLCATTVRQESGWGMSVVRTARPDTVRAEFFLQAAFAGVSAEAGFATAHAEFLSVCQRLLNPATWGGKVSTP